MKQKLYILCGIPFAGKTTIAQKISEKLGFIKVDLDEVKFQLFGNSIKDEDIDQKGWNKIYQRMYGLIEKHLKDGKTVIQDAGNFTKSERSVVRDIAEKLGVEVITIFVATPEHIAKERLLANKQKLNRFDITLASFQSAAQEMQIPQDDENVVMYDMQSDIDDWIGKHIG